MQNKNSISVVVPCFNSQSFISRTLKSLECQTVFPDEIIFVNDGSEDETGKIIENWIKDKKNFNIKLFNEIHNGPGSARNIGIKNSSNPWIAFLDSDDTWEKNKIEEIKNILEKNLNVNFITHYEYYVDESNSKSEISEKLKLYEKKNINIGSFLYMSNIFSTSAVVCRKDFLGTVKGFDYTLPNAQDYDLWLKLSKNIELVIIKKILGTYFYRNKNITSRPYYKRITSELKIALRYRKNVSNKLFLLKLLKIIFSKRWFKF